MTKTRHIKFQYQGTEYCGIALGKITAVLLKDVTIQTETPKNARTITKDEFCQKIRDTYWELFMNAAAIADKTSALEMIRWNILELRHDGVFQATTTKEEIQAMTEQIGTLHSTGKYLVAGHYGEVDPTKAAYGFERINIIDLNRIIGPPRIEKVIFRKNGRTEEKLTDARWIPLEEHITQILSQLYPCGFGEITPTHKKSPLKAYYVRTIPPEGLKYSLDTTYSQELNEELKKIKEALRIQAEQIMSRPIQL